MSKPVVFVQVEGGVAFVCSDGDVEVIEIDWDSCSTRGDAEAVAEIDAVLEQLLPYIDSPVIGPMIEIVKEARSDIAIDAQ